MKQASHIYSRSMKKKNRRDSAAFPVRPKKKGTPAEKIDDFFCVFYARVYLSMYVFIHACLYTCVCECLYVSFAYIYRDISSKNISSKLATIKISRKLANACVSRYVCVRACMCVCVYVQQFSIPISFL